MKKTCLFTIVAPNYIGQALSLKQSLAGYMEDIDFKIILVSDKKINIKGVKDEDIIYSQSIGINNYDGLCFSYSILEHCTNIKPAAIKMLLKDYNFVYYIDPDIYFYQNPTLINKLFKKNSVLLTPHTLSPILDNKKPTELEFLRTGTFNLGFIGVKKNSKSIIFLNWWAERCEKYGISETNSGLFVDQKWIDLCPSLFDFVEISRNKGLNVAYWNLHEREVTYKDHVYLVNQQPLLFFHFSGLDTANINNISKHQSRHNLINNTDGLRKLFNDYSKILIENSAHNINKGIPYQTFKNGCLITELARKYYWKHQIKYRGTDLFDSKSSLYRDCIKNKLIDQSNKIGPKIYGSQSDLKKYRLQMAAIELILRSINMIIGPNRYYLLKKYFIQRVSILSDFYKW